MTPPVFNLDDDVEVIDFPGRRFKISQIWKNQDGSISYSALGEAYHPASSLRLVEELKIGDWVEHDDIVFQIADISDGEPYYLHRSGKTFEKWYHPSALRKLTPEEIANHQSIQMSAKLDETQELRRRIHDLEMSLNGFTNGPEPEHVPGIVYVKYPLSVRVKKTEREQSAIIGRLCDVEESHANGSAVLSCDIEDACKRLSAIENRLAFIEKFQRDQDDLIGRAIRDGAVEISDFRRSG